MDVKIDNVGFVTATSKQRREGLLGWVTCTLNGGLQISGLTLRRTLEGNLALSFPTRRDRHGREHFFLRPLNDRARRDFEHKVIGALGFEEDVR